MKILLTGSSGFLGQRLLNKLLSNNHFVLGVDKKKGSIRYKKDNKLFLKKLKNSWDTSVRDVQKIRINIWIQ